MRLTSAIIVAYVLAGCAATHPGNAPQHPIIGTWTLNVNEISKMAGDKPALQKEITSTITFAPDGGYRAISRSKQWTETAEVHGKFRIVGSDVFVDMGTGDNKLLYEIRGSRLFVHDKVSPVVMVFDLQR